MKKLDIINSELFSNLLELNFQDQIIDLHNDYFCTKINYDQSFLLEFVATDSKIITLSFLEAGLNKFTIPLGISNGLTIDNFHRGRYELNGKLYDEYEEKKCFYIEFYEHGYIELLCKHAFVKIINE